jgi:transposase
MTIPGVGSVVALTYRATVACSLPQIQIRRRRVWADVLEVSVRRDRPQRQNITLRRQAQSMLRSKKWSWLKAWAMQVARRCGMKKAIVALARRLAVIMHRIWVDGTEFRWTREAAVAA